MANSSSTNLLTNNTTYLNTATSSVFYSSKLINYVEPIEIAGYQKTVFYSELNTNFNIGDRVFILDGNYDSNDYITQDKYTKYTDGYRILGVDGCRIILDLDYTGVSPYQVVNQDNVVNVYHISDQRQFDYINSIKIGFEFNGIFSKFYGTYSSVSNKTILYTNNIIFAATAFSPSNFIQNQNQGVYGANFYIANSNTSNIAWQQINLDDTINSNVTNGSLRIYIIGEDIIFNNLILKQRNVYKYQNGTWVIDTSYKQPIISKLNFRHGRFSGKHNDGVFGTNLIENNWNSATWNSGIFVNSNWNSGIMNSKSVVGNKSYYSKLGTLDGTTQSIPVQTIDYSNNKGFGYNIVIDSNIYTGNIVDGNFENCNIGLSSTYSSVDIYYGLTASYGLNVNKGQYKLCDINSVMANYSTVINCEIHNSIFTTSKLVNSQIYDTVADKSEFNADSGIKVISADLWSYTIGGSATSATSSIRGVIKLFISNDDLVKINVGDSFYVSKINKGYVLSSLTNDQKVLLPIETKYLFDSYFDSELSSDLITVSIKSKSDNNYSSFVTKNLGTFSTTTSLINSPLPSIDIESNIFGWYHVNGSNQYFNFITKDNVNGLFQDTYLHDADFKSGLFINSTWVSGDNKNYGGNIINRRVYNPPFLSIFYPNWATASMLVFNLDNTKRLNSHTPINSVYGINGIYGEDLFLGDNVWVSSIYDQNGKPIDDRYKVKECYAPIGPIFGGATSSYNLITELVPVTLTASYFSSINTYDSNGATSSNYVSISRFLISNSTIKSGTFKRTAIRNSIMENTLFDNTDTTLSPTNNDILKLTNIIFTDNNNTVNSGLINQSHFINGYWNNGIIYNSIWNGSTFNNGVFNSGYWVNGTFSGGIFLNSKNTKKTSVPFDNVKWIRTWLGGNFNAGQFSKSTWLNGTFNNGRFSESDWYGGIWNNGILGSSTIAYNNTTMGYYLPISGGATFTIWNNGIVDNALIGGSGSVYWYGGKFNGGEFTSFGKISSNESIWYGGDFNGGKVTGLSRWKNGNFNAGKFLSYYGYQNVSPTNSSTFSTDYGWENGRFNGGEFGNASTGTNSVWYNGEFNGGVFTGRFWNYGIFTKGSFIGSGLTSLSVNSYVQSFTNSYYGFWNDGFVSDRKNLIQTEKRIFTELIRKVDEKPILNDVFISNILWMSGTFSHGLGKLYNSTWLDGTFVKGSLINTQFNPYVDRTFTGATSYSFNFNDTCVWKNGNFINGSFYISEWENGIFYGGDMNGGIWRNGTWNYGKANNVYWENGLWRNGIWNGSLFTQSSIDSSYNVTPGYEHDIMINVAQASGTNSLHLINAISATYSTEYLSDPDFNNGLDANLTSTTKSLYSDDDWYNNSAYNDWLYIQSVFSINNYNVPQINLSSYDPNVYSRPNATADLYLTVDASKFGGSGPTLSVLQRLSGTAYDPTGIWQSSPDNTIFYDVSIDVCAEWGGSSAFWNQSTINYFSYLSDKEIIRVYYGSTYIDTTISTLVTSQSYQNPPRTNWYNYSRKTTINFSIQESQIILSSNKNRTIKINRLNVTGWAGPIVRILNASIKSRVSSYDPVNNTLYPAMPSAPTFSSNISIPNNLQLSVISGHYKVSLTFGNGLFKAGIWENGVWNNGWRKDECVKPFIFTSAVPMIDGHTWNITLHALGISSQIDNSMQSLSIGDKVSIGNIISIDKNNRRRLLKNYYRIISKDANTDGSFTSITCQVIVDFPIVNIEIDSLSHINYVTKNVWVSGIFLNGYFTGVWNDGLVKGRPYLTFLENTQWIDGQFNGGHFKGLTDSITNLLGDIISYVGTKKLGKQDIGSYIDSKYNTQNLIYYNNSLIQNFNFNDVYDVTSGTGSDARYDSWIDVNYSTQSQSNLNKESISYNSITFNGTQSEYIKNDYNLYGYPTYDILSSYSTLTDYDSINQKTYNLGSKYTTNYNFIPDNGNFNKPISTQISFVGTSNFDNNGWSFTNYSSGAGFSPVEYSSNIDSTTSGKLKFLGTTVNGTYSYGRLDNTNIKELVEKNRYYLMSLDIATTSGTSIMFKPSTTTTPGYFDHKNTTSNKKIEYFYNKQDLELTLFNWLGHYGSNNNLDIRFNNISFYEVDMIPFFQFTDPSNINSFVSAPYYVSYVPEIDYSNSNYNFINSVNIVIPLSEVVSQSLNYPNLNSLLLAEVPIIKSG